MGRASGQRRVAAGVGAKLFSVGKLAAGGEGYYLDSVAKGVEDYYLGRGEAPGVWLGAGCQALGLSGQVVGEDLVAVLGGCHPAGAVGLVSGKAAAAGRVPGFDLTFSAPKSVSLLSSTRWSPNPSANHPPKSQTCISHVI